MVSYHDPYVATLPKMRKYKFNLKSVEINDEKLKEFDCVLIVTNHDCIDYCAIKKSKFVVDTRGRYRNKSNNIVRCYLMKLLRITDVYPYYENIFYSRYPEVIQQPYIVQKMKYNQDFFAWAGCWCNALNNIGYEAEEIVINMRGIQFAWASENLLNSHTLSLEDIAIAQIKKFKPEILWFDIINYDLLRKIKSECTSIKLIMGWVGSAIAKTDQWSQMNVILSCAPESVSRLKSYGVKAEHIHHAFDPRINQHILKEKEVANNTFIGQIVRDNQFHLERERMLIEISKVVDLNIYSPSANIKYRDIIKPFLKQMIYKTVKRGENIGFEGMIKHIPIIQKALHWEKCPVLPVNMSLKNNLKRPVFGMEMFQIIRDSLVTLNIHADTSPIYASNMRLFETTGVGSCLVTDWKQNVSELFEEDTEIITYKSIDDCVEKIRWLNKHPGKARQIAAAGNKRCLNEHTFEHRILILDKLIKKYLV
ncbi:glycosyltransferase family protein [Anaerosinus massiliensis]|uniref:glycosyltransferase family protein n=1 Tax=Massilibacillus massiliensis TaxID=1806837 RepID=UPI000DA5F3B6|nr:glycosyltransferase [Massilibacillus massiliensis]